MRLNARKELVATSVLLILWQFSGFAQQIYQLPPFDVSTNEWQSDLLAGEIGVLIVDEPGRASLSLAHQLDDIPSMSLQRRGNGSIEPNLRGFSMDRIATSFNGHYLPIAAPTHTAAPVNYFPPVLYGVVNVVSGYGSVTMGPVPTGGRIDVDTTSSITSGEKFFMTVSSNPESLIAGVTGEPLKGLSGIRSSMSVYSSHSGDYESGNGQFQVDEKYSAWGVMASLESNPFQGSTVNLSLNYQSQDEANNPSLPLDSNGTEAVFLTGSWIQGIGTGELSIKSGYAEIRHRLSSNNRSIAPVAPLELIEAEALAESFSLRVMYTVSFREDLILNSGIDFNSQYRDALRQRFLKTGATLNDQIWPDIHINQPGAFLELSGGEASGLEWRFGGRIENTRMDANKVDAKVVGVPGAQGSTIGDNFSAFHGSDPIDVKNQDYTGSAHSIIKKSVSDGLDIIMGAGYTVAPAGPGESYRAFLSALGGGVELGNPELKPEEKTSYSIGLQYTSPRIRFSAEAWRAEIHNFVQREILSSTPLIYSFKNRDSRFKGIEAQIWVKPFVDGDLDALTFEFGYSRVVGISVHNGLLLPEVPPWDSRLVITWDGRFEEGPVSGYLLFRYTGEGINNQPELNPVFQDTDSFLLVDIGLSIKILKTGRLHFGVLNVLDELAYAYLQPPVTTGPVRPSGGNLVGGDRIPIPGRSFTFSVSWDF